VLSWLRNCQPHCGRWLAGYWIAADKFAVYGSKFVGAYKLTYVLASA